MTTSDEYLKAHAKCHQKIKTLEDEVRRLRKVLIHIELNPLVESRPEENYEPKPGLYPAEPYRRTAHYHYWGSKKRIEVSP